jgi:tetratricopeptide (TPR) repeat protein
MRLARALSLFLSLSLLSPVWAKGEVNAAAPDPGARQAGESNKGESKNTAPDIETPDAAAQESPKAAAADAPKADAVDALIDSESSATEPRATASLSPLPNKARHNDSLSDESEVSLENDSWSRYYNAGVKAAQLHIFDEAEDKLLQAIKQAKHGIAHEQQLYDSRNVLADVYRAQDEFHEAEKLYLLSLDSARRTVGYDSLPVAHAEEGLSEIALTKGQFAHAYEMCKHAIAVRRKILGPAHHDLGQAFVTMGAILGKEGWAEKAEKFYEHGLRILEEHPGVNQLDLADALRSAALFEQSRAHKPEAQALFDRSYSIKDRRVKYDQNSHLNGVVRFQWEEGSPRSQEIPDQDFPLRYFVCNNVRVAATVVDLWELIGVLISITNVGDQRAELGIGKVDLLRTSLDPFDPTKQKLEFIEPHRVDHVRREKTMWDLTQNRPWFANMQKTRNVRGLVPARGHDLFRGPNVFGIYGDWAAATRVLPEKFALEPSPERVQYQAEVIVDPSLVRTNNIKVLGLTPISLEPFESRTGYLLYLNPRCERLLLRATIGNATFEFPFKARKRRIGN